MPLHDLSNKVVLITGIGSVGTGDGNGTILALLFARQGALIYGCDINMQAAQRAADRILGDKIAKTHAARRTQSDFLRIHPSPVVGGHDTI